MRHQINLPKRMDRHDHLQASFLAMGTTVNVNPFEATHQLRHRLRGARDRLWLIQKGSAGRELHFAATIAQDAIMANAHEPPWQDVQEEPADKFRRLQSHDVEFVPTARITPLERDLAILECHQAIVADGHPMRIAAQIVHHFLGGAKRGLSVDDPLLFPQRLSKSLERLHIAQVRRLASKLELSLSVCLLQILEILAAEDLGEGLDGKEKVSALGGNPPIMLGRQGTAGNHTVDVNMVL